MELSRFARFFYQPVLPLGKNRSFVTCSKAHWALSKQAAVEGTVLLKNDGTLPLGKGSRVCLFGIGAGEFLLGGGGSAEVFSDREVTLDLALRSAMAAGEIAYFPDTAAYYQAKIQEAQKAAFAAQTLGRVRWRRGYHTPLPELPETLYQRAAEFADTAIFCLSRFSSEGDDNGDRTGEKGDFYLWEEEQQLLDRLYKDFSKVIVILNTCGPVSTREYDRANAILYPLYGGGLAGEALTEILLGKAYPSGHLQHTLAYDLEDYPSTRGFQESQNYVNCTEDIFVGYRYFETFAPEKVAYPFGFGLGYTTFRICTTAASLDKNTVNLTVRVENTGNFPGKEVVQVYLTAPQGLLGKAQKVLTAFAKTKQLQPGECQTLKLHFDIREFGAFDDLGKVCQSAFVLERGTYTVWVGDNVRDTEKVLVFTLAEDKVCKKCRPYLAPRDLPERLCADGSYEKLPPPPQLPHPIRRYRPKAEKPAQEITLETALETGQLDAFLASLTDQELGQLLHGQPMTNVSLTNGIGLPPRNLSSDKKRIPLVPTTDGPSGIRVRPGRGVETTFFPCQSAMAQTWNLPLLQKLGTALAAEAKENNIGIWLAPGLNIHRSPLCGRNFEYYSEDPLATGLLACACIRGVQSMRIAATVKHFCCNNRENDRRICDSRVSQRALREIYLRGFEIAIKKAKPWAVMTAYNPVNGTVANANWEAVNGVLRTDWGYDGVVMTDWWVLSTLEDEVHAGSDVKMPESVSVSYGFGPAVCDPAASMAQGTLDRGAALLSARRILTMLSKLE